MADWSGLRALVSEVNFQLISGSVEVTVRRPAPDSDPIETRGIWITPAVDDFPSGEVMRRDVRRVIALPKVAVPTVPIGTLIEADDEHGNDGGYAWLVDGFESSEADHTRVTVIPVST